MRWVFRGLGLLMLPPALAGCAAGFFARKFLGDPIRLYQELVEEAKSWSAPAPD